MTVSPIGRLAAILLLTAGLAGCMDMSVDVEVTSQTTARATMTQVMSAQVYPMIKASQAENKDAKKEEAFCAEGKLTENTDGSADCVIVKEGPFAELTFDETDGEEAVTFTSPGPGLVRVAFNTKDMRGDVTESGGEQMDAETKKMMEAYFQGHFITLRVAGGEITETNMEIAADKRSAETKISFVELLNGKAELPDELFAVVKK